MDNARIAVLDAKQKVTAMSLNIVELTAANFDFKVAEVNTLASALSDIMLSGCMKHSVSHDVVTNWNPANGGGLRGTKAVIKWYSPNEAGDGQYGSNEIGGVDYTQFTNVGGKLLLQGGFYDDIKAAFDAVAVTENGNAVEVYEIECVSRGL